MLNMKNDPVHTINALAVLACSLYLYTTNSMTKSQVYGFHNTLKILSAVHFKYSSLWPLLDVKPAKCQCIRCPGSAWLLSLFAYYNLYDKNPLLVGFTILFKNIICCSFKYSSFWPLDDVNMQNDPVHTMPRQCLLALSMCKVQTIWLKCLAWDFCEFFCCFWLIVLTLC